jgi:formylglycine-generating enzyme required for sulfatase activity
MLDGLMVLSVVWETKAMECDVFADILAVTSPVRMECVRVPAGEFLMGSALAKDREVSKGELPQHRVYLAEFYIGKYPVTNAQHAAFVQSATMICRWDIRPRLDSIPRT